MKVVLAQRLGEMDAQDMLVVAKQLLSSTSGSASDQFLSATSFRQQLVSISD